MTGTRAGDSAHTALCLWVIPPTILQASVGRLLLRVVSFAGLKWGWLYCRFLLRVIRASKVITPVVIKTVNIIAKWNIYLNNRKNVENRKNKIVSISWLCLKNAEQPSFTHKQTKLENIDIKVYLETIHT